MTTPILLQKKRSKLWVKCLVLSATAHFMVGGYLYYHPLLIQSPLQSLFGISLAEPKPFPHDLDIDFIDKNFLLEDVFSTVLVNPSQLRPPYDLEEPLQGIALSPKEESAPSYLVKVDDASPFNELIDKKTLSKEATLKQLQEMSPAPLFQALEEDAKLAVHLPLDTPLPLIEVPSVESISPSGYEDRVLLDDFSYSASKEKEGKRGLFFKESVPEIKRKATPVTRELEAQAQDILAQERKPTLFTPKTPSITSRARPVQLGSTSSNFELYAFPELSPTALWDEDFVVDVSFAPHPEGKGYLFALSLNSVKDLSNHSLKQNFYFLLDRSSSSQKHHFPVFKRATLKALSSIQPDDAFNIFIIDKHITKFSPKNLAASLKNRRAAEEFLDSQESSTLFSSGDIYSSLTKILSLIPDDKEMHSALLLTDGQSNFNAGKKKDAFTRWLTENEGKVTLYAAATGKDNDLLSLDLLSTESGGKLLYSDTHASFPRKLAKLVLDLKTPLAKQIDISVRPHQPQSYIELYPAAYTLAPLYANEPYQILGEIDHLAPFDLILEGRHNDDWIRIDKKISFQRAKAADPRVVKQWKKMQASVCYAKFLEEGKASYLKDAKQILNQAQKEIAFE